MPPRRAAASSAETAIEVESSPVRATDADAEADMSDAEGGLTADGEDEEEKPKLMQDEDRDDANTFRILLATDSHLGFMETDPVRGMDSFIAFGEVLELAREKEVDFLLLAGDLFHENYPSKHTLHETSALLRKYTQGDRPVRIELLSDPDEGQVGDWDFPTVNYEDYNINVSLPIFSIHGNHDDPTGTGESGALSILDILSKDGFVNYFGKTDLPKHTKYDKDGVPIGLTVEPVLLRKGTTSLALYGMGNVKDARMNAELRAGRVVLHKPAPQKDVEFFNILLVHQNRVAHNRNEFVPENMFDNDTDLVVWGHEHDCRIVPEPVADRTYFISQPGSSVATSLTAGEALEKNVGLLLVRGKEFVLTPIPLKTVRPFVVMDLVMEDEAEEHGFDIENKTKVTEFLREKVKECVAQALEQWDAKNSPEQAGSQEVDAPVKKPKPLVRLKVETTGMELINRARFGESVNALVANPSDILAFWQRKKPSARREKVTVDEPDLLEGEDDDGKNKPKVTMAELVNKFLAAQELKVLPEQGMELAVEQFVKGSKSAISDFVNLTLKSYHKSAEKGNTEEDGIDAELERQKSLAVTQIASQQGEGGSSSRAAARKASKSKDTDEEMEVSDASSAPSGKGKGKAPAKKAAPKKAAPKKAPTKGKGKEKLFDDEDESGDDIVMMDDDDDNDEVAPSLDDFDEDDSDDAPPRRGGKKALASSSKSKAPAKAPAKKATPAPRARTPASSARSQLSFAPPPRTASARAAKAKPPVYELDDSDD